MKDVLDRNVLDAVVHSLEFELYSIESSDGTQTVYGLRWNRLQGITGAATPELEASTIRLAAAGLIHCGGASHSVFDWLLGQRPATFFWATAAGHRLIAERDLAGGDQVNLLLRDRVLRPGSCLPRQVGPCRRRKKGF